MEILTNQTLAMDNVLSFRGRVTQQDLAMKVNEMEDFIKASGTQKTGPSVTTTFSILPGTTPPVMDVEILMPLSEEVTPKEGFTLKKQFCLSNALKLEYKGNPMGIQKSIMDLNLYISSHNMVPVTSLYYVAVKEARTATDADSMEVHIYLGVSENTNTL